MAMLGGGSSSSRPSLDDALLRVVEALTKESGFVALVAAGEDAKAALWVEEWMSQHKDVFPFNLEEEVGKIDCPEDEQRESEKMSHSSVECDAVRREEVF